MIEDGITSCREVERIVWTEGPEAAPAGHLAECRSCQGEARRAADLRAALAGMRNRLAVPPAALEEAVLAAAALRSPLARVRAVATHPKFWRGAAVGAATAAAATLGLLAARRRVAARAQVA